MAQLTPAEVVTIQTRWLDSAEQACCRAVVQQLTSRQLDVLHSFAAGRSSQEIAKAMNVTVKAVHAPKTIILNECRNAWGLPDGTRLDYHFLHDKFGRYFQVPPA